MSAFRAFCAGRSTDRHSTGGTITTDVCAAHQWMDAWQTLAAVRPPVIWAPITLITIASPLSLVLHLRCFDYTCLRGPPSVLS